MADTRQVFRAGERVSNCDVRSVWLNAGLIGRSQLTLSEPSATPEENCSLRSWRWRATLVGLVMSLPQPNPCSTPSRPTQKNLLHPLPPSLHAV